MTENEFMKQQQAAVERMKEMNSRATAGSTKQPMPPVPPFVRLQGNNNRQQTRQKPTEDPPLIKEEPKNENHTAEPIKSGGFLSSLNIPFLDIFSKETDISLIIGLLLILMSEKADKKLLFALIYILM